MSLLSVFALMCCTVVCVSSQTCSGDSCKKFSLNKEHLNKRFRGQGLYEVMAPGHHDCVRNCFNLSPCKSIDYNKKDKMCKLNDVDSTQITASEDFEQQNGAIFSDITAWPPSMAGKCGLRPCSMRQRCIPDKDAYHCADISCGDAPDIKNGKAVLSKTGKYLYGDTATVQCDTGYRPNQSIIQCSILEKWEKAVCVKVDARNVAINKPTSMSSVWIYDNAYSGEKGVDGEIAYSGEKEVDGEIAYSGEKGSADEIAYSGEKDVDSENAYSGEKDVGGEIAYSGEKGVDGEIAYSSEKGVDGDVNQDLSGGSSCFYTFAEMNPWWRVDLEAIYGIVKVKLFNRMDCCSWRANNLSLAFGMSDQNMEQVGFVPGQIDDIHTFAFPTAKEARYVQVQLIGVDTVLHLCEVQVFGIPV